MAYNIQLRKRIIHPAVDTLPYFLNEFNGLIYVERYPSAVMRDIVRQKAGTIEQRLRDMYDGIGDIRLIRCMDMMEDYADVLRYNAPWLFSAGMKPEFDSREFLKLLDFNDNFHAGFIKVERTRRDDEQVFAFCEVMCDTVKDGDAMIDALFDLYQRADKSVARIRESHGLAPQWKPKQDDCFCCNTDMLEDESELRDIDGDKLTASDLCFDYETKKLIDEVRERIKKLRLNGVSQWVLDELVKSDRCLSVLSIGNDCRLSLPDYNNIEIRMEPLPKAVFFLFLRHPEGILFKHLPDYREELARIYADVRRRSSLTPLTEERLQASVEAVTNPLSNSINEKCARIREAFVREFSDNLAEYYYVTGMRGCAKTIKLSRSMVWGEY